MNKINYKLSFLLIVPLLFIISTSMILTNVSTVPLQTGSTGKLVMKMIQVLGYVLLPSFFIILGYIKPIINSIQVLIQCIFNSIILFLVSLSIGLIRFYPESFLNQLFPFISSETILPASVLLFLLFLLFFYFKQSLFSKKTIVGLISLFLFLWSISNFFPNHPNATILLMNSLILVAPAVFFLFGTLFSQTAIKKNIRLYITAFVSLAILNLLFFINRTTLVNFSKESGTFYSNVFLQKILISPLPFFIGFIVITFISLLKIDRVNMKLTSYLSINLLYLFLNPLIYTAFEKFNEAAWLTPITAKSLLLLILKNILIVIFILVLMISLQIRFFSDVSIKDLSLASILYTGLILIFSFNLFLDLANSKFDPGKVFWWHARSFDLYLINLILLAILYFICLALINRFWYTNIVFSIICIIYGFANYQKVIFRDEPITPIDLANYQALPELIQMVGIQTVVIILVALILLILLAILLQRRIPKGKILKLPSRLVILVLSGLFIYNVSNVTANYKYNKHTGIVASILEDANFAPNPQSLWYNSKLNGNLLAFLSLSNVTAMREPTDYTEESIKNIEQKYQKEANLINKDRQSKLKDNTVVYILSESFSDPQNLPDIQLSKDPIPNVRKLMAETTSGQMFSMGYGGGTANIEYEALTSFSMDNFDPAMTTPYLFVVPKAERIFSINQLYDKSIAIHPYTASTYKRDLAFEKMKFDKFYYLGNDKFKLKYQDHIDNSQYISDESAFNEVLDHLHDSKGNTFIQLTTMQNHMPYDKDVFKNTITASGNLAAGSKQKVETFAQGIHYTDQALTKFMTEINKLDKSVTVVFYGDHLPAIYYGGILEDKDFKIQSHLTDYFIYNNKNPQKIVKDFATPNMFTPLMLEQSNQPVTAYSALMTQVAKKLPAMELQQVINEDGKEINQVDLSKEQKELLEEYKLVQYDLTSGKNFLNDNFFYKIP